MTYLLARSSFRTLFVAAMPKTTNLSLGYWRDPLAQTLYKQQFNHVSHLRDHGAAPNSRCASYKGPGCHLRVTAQKLLWNTPSYSSSGAQTSQSGAMHMTAEKGRVDVLDESFEPKVGFLSHRNGQQQASDTLLMIATRHGQHEAAWRLLGRDASLKISGPAGENRGNDCS